MPDTALVRRGHAGQVPPGVTRTDAEPAEGWRTSVRTAAHGAEVTRAPEATTV